MHLQKTWITGNIHFVKTTIKCCVFSNKCCISFAFVPSYVRSLLFRISFKFSCMSSLSKHDSLRQEFYLLWCVAIHKSYVPLHVVSVLIQMSCGGETLHQQALAFDLQIAGRGRRSQCLSLRGPFPDRECRGPKEHVWFWYPLCCWTGNRGDWHWESSTDHLGTGP